jgi:hypothetical protein
VVGGGLLFGQAREQAQRALALAETGPARHLLHRLLHAQRAYRHRPSGRWAGSLRELGLEKLTHRSLTGPRRLEVSGETFTLTACVRAGDGEAVTLRLHQDSRPEQR